MMLPENIRITAYPGNELRQFIAARKYSRVAVLADENTARFCYPVVADSLPNHSVIKIPAGEQHKTLQTCTGVWQAMTDQQLDRHAVLVVIGGGVAGDLGGFCAATYKRGIDFILLPTTLLAQADASIGGKLGIDFGYYKNHLGIFREPALNLISPGFLNTLPPHELRSGFAEIIKHALISDAALWELIRSKPWQQQDWERLVSHSAGFKADIVKQDPHEKGLRKILNAGHTIGHAIESWFLANKAPILHGEAVAAGLICEAWIAYKRHSLREEELNSITTCILPAFGKLSLAGDLSEIAKLCLQDKKNKDNTILMALLDRIGRARWDVTVMPDEIVDSLTYYRSLYT